MKQIRLKDRLVVVRFCGECPMMEEIIRDREYYSGNMCVCGVAPIYITDKTIHHNACPLEDVK